MSNFSDRIFENMKWPELSDPYSAFYKRLHPDYNGERIFCEYPGGTLYTADEILEIMNRNWKDAEYQAEARK